MFPYFEIWARKSPNEELKLVELITGEFSQVINKPTIHSKDVWIQKALDILISHGYVDMEARRIRNRL